MRRLRWRKVDFISQYLIVDMYYWLYEAHMKGGMCDRREQIPERVAVEAK